MRIGTVQKRSFLRKAYAAAVAASATLRAQLESYSVASSAQVLTGQLLSSTSANGAAASFSAPGKDGLSPLDAGSAWEELIELLDQVEDDSPSLTTDAQKFAEMIGRLTPIKSCSTNFSGLRSVYP